MSDSIAISTIRALSSRSNYGSLPRPPAENRIKLYGLYKQATEGDVKGIMLRPVGFTPEDEGAKKKWDAWKREEGLPKTEAKKKYIAFLIETMRVYASGTHEARELLNELEYLWEQIKDLPISDEENDYHMNLPSRSPSFSQADRFSNRTPSIGGRGGGGGGGAASTLSNIYSHTRRNTTLSLNDYVQQQRLQHQSQLAAGFETGSQTAGFSGGLGGGGGGPGSISSMPVRAGSNINTTSNNNGGNHNKNIIEDFKNWQSDVNAIINKLTREFISSRRENQSLSHGENDDNESVLSLDEIEITKRRIVRILKVVGINILKFFKNFAVSLIAILFLVWCIKKNVVVKNTIVKHANSNGKEKKELIINMVLNTDENKWFIRLLNFINSFVGFV
ncbi:hypothetical protein KGF56_001054 [Candida oxycetoniae]|uniref:ACB domain-containing protein n=1 Tax=Candida oxycetoniae TaxID=497107 RepID=A0AAI9T0K6_9ASCO|nr:uncharacterized protein KGF56_001054 [Candida oxycetoniae]KAI3406212.2 hypothetical protein KGF56_001054 [Candida oxycetoniae]